MEISGLSWPKPAQQMLLQVLAHADPGAARASFEEWRGSDREHVTIQDLWEHASGLPARLVDSPPIVRREFNLMFSSAVEAVSGISQTVTINIEIEARPAE